MRRSALLPLLCLLLLLAATACAAAVPAISRITDGNQLGATAIILGADFVPGQTEVWVWNPPDSADIGVPDPPPPPPPNTPPPSGGKKCEVLSATTDMLAVPLGKPYLTPAFVWVKTPGGTSSPYLVDAPDLYFAASDQAVPGQTLQVYGKNLFGNPYQSNRRVFLVSAADAKVYEGDWGGLWTQSWACVPRYAFAATLPNDIPPGAYKLYLNCGSGGIYGWSNGIDLTVVAPRRVAPRLVKPRGLAGDGFTDDTVALQKALDEAGKRTPATVLLPAGRFAISTTLRVPEGVSLAGLGRGATALCVNPDRPLRGGMPATTWTPSGKVRRGSASDWYPYMAAETPMLWLQGHSTLSDLALIGGPGAWMLVHIAADTPEEDAVDITLRSLQLTNQQSGFAVDFLAGMRYLGREDAAAVAKQLDDAFADFTAGRITDDQLAAGQKAAADRVREAARKAPRWHGVYHAHPGGVMAVSPTLRFTVSGCHFDQAGVSFLPGKRPNRYANITDNQFLRGGVGGYQWYRCMIQHNVMDAQGYGRGFLPGGPLCEVWLFDNTIRNTGRVDNGNEVFMPEYGGGHWYGAVQSSTHTKLTAADARWLPGMWADERYRIFAYVTSGRGVGQYRRVVANTADTLTLETPWRVVPDATSRVALCEFVNKSLWINDSMIDCEGPSQFWGAAVDNVIEGFTARDSGEWVLFAHSLDPAPDQPLSKFNYCPMAFNEVLNVSMFNSGSLRLAGFYPEAMKDGRVPGPGHLLANSIRWCKVRTPNPLAMNQYWPYWLNPRFLPNADPPGLGISAPGAFNVLEYNYLLDCPVGVSLPPDLGIRNTVVLDNRMDRVTRPIANASTDAVIREHKIPEGPRGPW